MTEQPLPTVPVRYTCKPCGLTQRRVNVPARASAAVDVRVWMAHVRHLIAHDHARRSPFCRSTACDLMIPLANEGGWIGQAQETTKP